MKVVKINIRPVIGYSGSVSLIWISFKYLKLRGEFLKSMTKNANQVAKFTVQFQLLKFGLGQLATYTSVIQNAQRNAVSRRCPYIHKLAKVSKFFPLIRFISERWTANRRIENVSIIVLLVAFNHLLGRFDCFLLLNRVQKNIYRQGGKPTVTSLITRYRCLVSSVWRAPVCQAEDRGFKPQPDHHSGSLNNWEECAAFVMTSANG